MLYGREALLPVDYLGPSFGYKGSVDKVQIWISHLEAHAEELRNNALENLRNVQAAQKLAYDLKYFKGNVPDYRPGDKVWIHNSALDKQWSRKLDDRWIGPFKIVEKMGKATYSLKDGRNRLLQSPIHNDRLKLYVPPRRMMKEIVVEIG